GAAAPPQSERTYHSAKRSPPTLTANHQGRERSAGSTRSSTSTNRAATATVTSGAIAAKLRSTAVKRRPPIPQQKLLDQDEIEHEDGHAEEDGQSVAANISRVQPAQTRPRALGERAGAVHDAVD